MVPGLALAALPFLYLNTHLHELSHALAALATGGRVDRILVHGDGSGVALVAGGNLLLVASAGYVGSAMLGGLMIVYGNHERSARNVLWATAAALAISMLIWVRGDLIGILSGLMWIGACALAAKNLRERTLIFTVQLLGTLQCVAAFRSLFDLLQISALTETHSDAQIMAQASGIPDVVWAVSWAAISSAVLWTSLRLAWRGPRKR